MSKFEDALAKIVITQENSMTTIRSIEIQMGQMAKQIAQITNEQIDEFSGNTIEHCNNVVAEKEDETEGKRDEKEREKKRKN